MKWTQINDRSVEMANYMLLGSITFQSAMRNLDSHGSRRTALATRGGGQESKKMMGANTTKESQK